MTYTVSLTPAHCQTVLTGMLNSSIHSGSHAEDFLSAVHGNKLSSEERMKHLSGVIARKEPRARNHDGALIYWDNSRKVVKAPIVFIVHMNPDLWERSTAFATSRTRYNRLTRHCVSPRNCHNQWVRKHLALSQNGT
jgi:hypothetical protein